MSSSSRVTSPATQKATLPAHDTFISTCDVSDAMQQLGYLNNIYLPTPKLINPPFSYFKNKPLNSSLDLNPIPNTTSTFSLNSDINFLNQKQVSDVNSFILNSSPKKLIVGPAFTVQLTLTSDPSCNSSLPQAHFVDACPKDHIIVIAVPNNAVNAVLGGLVAMRAASLGCLGVVTNGFVRDIDEFNLPVFAKGCSIQSSQSRTQLKFIQQPILLDQVWIQPGDMMYADLHGVAVVPSQFNSLMLKTCETLTHINTLCMNDLKLGKSLTETLAKYRTTSGMKK